MENRKTPVGRQIRDMLLVFLLGGVSAVILALGTLYYFGPTESYRVTKILLSDEVAGNLSYPDINTETGKSVRYTFDRVEFQYFDKSSSSWKRTPVDLSLYKKFYSLISSDVAMSMVPENVIAIFTGDAVATLDVIVRQGEKESQEKRSFQEVQIVEGGDYYRIELRHQGKARDWAYFYHEDIYQLALETFLSK